jgi:ABC-type nitrate/sulfonate/bicarbonate transport system substrate-binding protein
VLGFIKIKVNNMSVKAKKYLLVSVVVSVCTVVLVGSLILGDSKPQVINRVKIAVPMSITSSPFLVAQELKLFQEQGLEIQIFPCASGIACMELLNQRNVDYSVASESVVMFQSYEHDDLALLVSFVESDNDLKLLTLEASRLDAIDQLSGKRVGVIQGTSSEFYLDSVLTSHNLKHLPIEKVYLKHYDIVDAFLSFDVDAIATWEPIGYKADLLSASKVLNLGKRGIYQLSFNLVSRNAYLEFSQDEPTRLLQSLEKAIDYMDENPSEAQEIVAQRLDMPLDQIHWSWKDYVFRLSLGNSLLSNLQLQSRWAMEHGLVEQPSPNFRTLFYKAPYQQLIAQRD